MLSYQNGTLHTVKALHSCSRQRVTSSAFKSVLPSTKTLWPVLLWSGSLQHMMGSWGEKVTLWWIVLSCVAHVVTWQWRTSKKRSVELESLCLARGIMRSWYAVERHPGLKLWHAVTSLACWLLGCWKRLAYIWNCWHELTPTPRREGKKNVAPIRINCGFLTSTTACEWPFSRIPHVTKFTFLVTFNAVSLLLSEGWPLIQDILKGFTLSPTVSAPSHPCNAPFLSALT